MAKTPKLEQATGERFRDALRNGLDPEPGLDEGTVTVSQQDEEGRF